MARIPPLTHHRTPRRILRAKCQVVRESDFRLVADQVVDLSPTGALVMPADPVLTGEAVIVSFKLPHIPYWLDAEATVARVVHERADVRTAFGDQPLHDRAVIALPAAGATELSSRAA